ncbi:calmodulin-binding protein Sha1 [Aspergillus egyptiacus]|nr:calmodulin-binding protein Sha1 [Aspergillus egyptiacus]
MSGPLEQLGTPCPRRSRYSDESTNGSDQFDSLWDDSIGDYDDTRNIDFTTEIKSSTLAAKPKRRTNKSSPFIIHSDHNEKSQATVKQKRDIKPAFSGPNRKSSLLAQPAQRFRPRVSFAPSPIKPSRQQGDEPMKRRRPHVQNNNELLKVINAGGNDAPIKDTLKKDIRRNTVYIPSDDTTVASVFMDLFSPLKTNNLEHHMAEAEIGSLESQLLRKRQAKKSQASPGRALQPSRKVSQESCSSVDIPGKNGGKENIPPGMAVVDDRVKDAKSTKLEPVGNKSNTQAAVQKHSVHASTNANNRPLALKSSNISVQKKGIDCQTAIKPSVLTVSDRRPASNNKMKNEVSGSALSNPLRSSDLKALNREYPPVTEVITNPALYDDDWLSHQEVILTQLVNALIISSSGPTDESAILRHEFLALYQSTSFTELHKRLQASLMYGALSIPKDVLTKNSRLRHDLGMKRKFVDIWLESYDPKLFKAALETVTGRVIPDVRLASNAGTSTGRATDKALKKRLGKFLDAILVQNQDTEFDATDPEALGRLYRRTVLRSIMLVVLLDKARLSPESSVSGCLFLSSSSYKSSVAVLQALGRFLLPSCGDINKALGQLDCQVHYQQHPIEEYEYELSNLAVDLRDGVRLTRIVELLFYPSQTPHMPDTEKDQWPLSRRLKFPCLSRAVKIFNARTALDALASTDEGRRLISNTQPEDIVNGHREKTIALLWGLVSKWGLTGLVDLEDLRREIWQLKRRIRLGAEVENYSDPLKEQDDEPGILLKEWASLVTQLRGLYTDNSNLGDPRVYECILDEYEGYMQRLPLDSISKANKPSLETRLRALGCSTQFIRLLSPTRSSVLDSHSTTGALAFLCSRLLPATKRVRAAMVLQNAWRRVLQHRETQRRLVARDIARQCAAVVQTRDRILWAKEVIIHWWRMSRTRRRQRRITMPARAPKDLGLRRKSTRIPLRQRRIV